MCGKRINSKCVCEAFNLNAILIIISLFRLPLPVGLKVPVVCCCSLPALCTAEDEEGESWHRDYWEDVSRFKRVKITRETDSLWTSCAATHFYFCNLKSNKNKGMKAREMLYSAKFNNFLSVFINCCL